MALNNTQRGGLLEYTRNVAANKNSKIEVRGTTIRVSDAPFPVKIVAHNKKLNDGRGTSYTLTMKKFEKWFTDLEYDEIEIINSASTAATVVLQLGYGDFEAEILSRTQAASSIASYGETFTEATLDPSSFVEYPLISENLQRKSAHFFISVGSDTGDAAWTVGPPNAPNLNAVRAYADIEAVNDGVAVDVTAAVSVYVYVRPTEEGGAQDTNVITDISAFEEIYSAS